MVVYVLDGGEKEPEIKAEKTIYVHSKSDIKPSSGLSFSSLTGEGIDKVIDAISHFLSSEINSFSDCPVIESKRQKDKIDETINSLKEAIKNKDMSVDIIALYFQEALSSLSELTGEVTTDDVLDVLFSSFCLGK